MKSFFLSIGVSCFSIFIVALFTSDSIYLAPDGKRLQPAPVSIHQHALPAAMSFAGEQVPMHDYVVREQMDFEIGLIVYKQAYTLDLLKSSTRYFPIIEQVLAENGIPADFKYLVVAESNLENATSPKGAKGFWQIMEGTGEQLGLEINEEVDERMNIEKSGRAACKYLKDAYGRFGNWTMAAASYNCGMAGLREQVNLQVQDEYFDLYLNPETARYMYRILAYKQVMENSSLYGYELTPNDYYPIYGTREVNVTSIPNLADFARSYGTTYKMVKILNPWLRKTNLPARGSGKVYTVKLPG